MSKIVDTRKKVVTGTMRASRAVSNVEPDYMHFEIVDDLSRCAVCTVKMSLLDYANMLTAHEAKVEITVWKDAPIGKKYEHKNEIVEFAYEIGKETESRERALEALKPFEVDGWKGNVDHIFTQRRYKNIGYVVSFKRYVDVEDANAQ